MFFFMTFPLKNNILNEGKGGSMKTQRKDVQVGILDNLLHLNGEWPLLGKGESDSAGMIFHTEGKRSHANRARQNKAWRELW